MTDSSRSASDVRVTRSAHRPSARPPWHHCRDDDDVRTDPDRAASELRGTWYILPTPFDVDGALDLTSLARLVEAAIDWGVDGLTAMGVMAEPASLTPDEREAALRTIVEAAAGRVPVAVGCSGPSVGVVVARRDQARRLGAVAAMVAPPTLLRNVDLLPGFYRAVAAATRPAADRPGRAGGDRGDRSRSASSSPASPAREPGRSSSRTRRPRRRSRRLLAADPGLAVFGGLGGAAALWELERGACGTMTGFAYPEVLRAIRRRARGRRSRPGRPPVRPLPAAARLRGPADRRAGHPQGGPPPTRSARPTPAPAASAVRSTHRPRRRSRRSSTGSGSSRRSTPYAAGALIDRARRTDMDLGLTGRTALVGGASSGLGRAIAAALAAEGCRLAIWSRGGPGLERGRDRPARAVRHRGRRPRGRRGRARAPGRRIAAEALGRPRHDRHRRPQRRRAAAGRPDRDRRSRLGARLPAPVDHPDRAGDGPPAGDARARLGPDRRDPVVGRPPADPRPRLLERRPRRPDGLAEDDRPDRGRRRRDGQRRPAGPAPDAPDRQPRPGSRRSGPARRSRRSGPPTWPRSRPGATVGRRSSPPASPTCAPTRRGYQTGTFTAIDGGLIAGLP